MRLFQIVWHKCLNVRYMNLFSVRFSSHICDGMVLLLLGYFLPIIMLSELRIRMCLMPIWLFHFLYFTLSLTLCVSVSVNSQWGFLHNLCSFRFYWKWNDYGCVGFFCRQTKNTRCLNLGMLRMDSICLYVNVNLPKFFGVFTIGWWFQWTVKTEAMLPF